MSVANEAETINAAGEDPVPYIQTPLDVEVTLLRGLYNSEDDVWYTKAVVRELTGGDEESLAALEGKKGLTYTDYIDAVLSLSVLSIGDIEVSKVPGVLGKLIVGDRNMLFLGLLRATYGNEREFRVNCPECSTKNDVTIHLVDDFQVTTPDFDVRKPFEVKLRKGVQQVRIPNGEDTTEAQKGKTDAELNTILISRCAVFGDNPPEDKLHWARSLNVADRRKLVAALADIEVGPHMEAVETQCDECGADMPILLDWVSLLLG